MIEQRFMKPGQFSLRLKADAPWSKKQAIREFDHIVVMPNVVDPNSFSDADILDASAYVGVITRCDTKSGTFEGSGLAYWLGTPDGVGDILDTAVSLTGATVLSWVTALCPSSLTVGTADNAGSLTASYQWMTRREALDDVCRQFDYEWRVNNDFSLDVFVSEHAVPSTRPPQVIVSEMEEGQDGDYRGLQGQLSQQVDVTKYATAVIVVAQGSGSTVATAAATSGASTYRDGRGNLVVMEALVNAPSTPSARASTAASAALREVSSAARQVSISSDTYDVTRFAKPGDNVFAYDIEAQLYGGSTQVTYRGELTDPTKLRVYALTWPVMEGMSVFVRRSNGVGSFTYTDLTDCFDFETGDVTWEVGAVDPSVAPNITSLGAPAYLGNNPDIAQRTASIAPLGRIGLATATSNQTGITATVDLTGLSVTFTAYANRSYRLTAQCYLLSTVAGDVGNIAITDSTNTQVQSAQVPLTGTATTIVCSTIVVPSAGSVTYKVRAARGAGTGSLTMSAGATFPATFLVEDIGAG